jgi:hypothetical protein
MKHISTFESFLNKNINEGKIGDKLIAKFIKETGINLYDEVKKAGEPGKWLVTRLWAPQDTGGFNPGLHMEITQKNTTAHWMVMDDNGKLSDNMKEIKKV